MSEIEHNVRVYSSAAQYVQGPGAINHLGAVVARLGGKAYVLIDTAMYDSLARIIEKSISLSSGDTRLRGNSGEVTWQHIRELTADGAVFEPTCVIGVGGGKTIDLAKGVSRELELPIVTVPTIASNDSPASRVIAIYEDHQLVDVVPMTANPACVVVDSEVIIGAPTRFLSAGIGDAIAKHSEVEACWESGGVTSHGTRGLRAARLLAEGSYRILRNSAVEAIQAARAGNINQAFEDTLEAVILLSGLAFENGGLSVAHAATRGLMDVAPLRLHGEHVAYGLMIQRALNGDTDGELRDHANFLRAVELPTSLAELGVSVTDESLIRIAELTCTAPHIVNFTKPVTIDLLVQAMRRLETLFGESLQ